MTCSLVEKIKEHVPLIMRLLQGEVGDYYFDEPTKCLYTAVMIIALYLGKTAASITTECDVANVEIAYKKDVEHYTKEVNTSLVYLNTLMHDILDRKPQRRLYYIMITNADLKDASGNLISFPGHVSVIEKVNPDKFLLYQSYINGYTLKEAFDKNNGSFIIDRGFVETILSTLKDLFTEGNVWTNETTKLWQKWTFTDESRFEGVRFLGLSHVCYRKVVVKHCSQVFKRFVTAKLPQLDEDMQEEARLLIKKL